MNKFVFVACVVIIAVCNAQDRPRSDDFKKVMDQCKAETGATDDDVKTLVTRQPMTSKNGWCLIGCIKKKSGVMDANNKIDMAKLKEQMSGMQSANSDMFSKFMGVMQQCKDQVESDPKNYADSCTAAQSFGTCFYAKKAAAGIP